MCLIIIKIFLKNQNIQFLGKELPKGMVTNILMVAGWLISLGIICLKKDIWLNHQKFIK